MTYSELKSLGLGVAQLKQLKRNVQMLIEDKVTGALEVNMKCKIDSPKAKGVYTITKLNRKTATLVSENTGGRVRASLSMLLPA